MEETFVNLQKELNIIKNHKTELNQIIENYTFYFISMEEKSENNQENSNNIISKKYLSNDAKIKDNFKESNAIFVNQSNEYNENDIFLIIGFKNAIIIIHKSLLSIFLPFFTDNSDLPIYFLSNSVQNFDINIANKKFDFNKDCDVNFKEEIERFSQVIQIYKKLDQSILDLWKTIQPCITGYLIKQAYAKIKKKPSFDFFF